VKPDLWTDSQSVGATLLMGGSGVRFGCEVPKQFLLLCGKKVFYHPLETFIQSGFFEEIVLVCHPEWVNIPDLPDFVRVVSGGKTRQDSSLIGLQSFTKKPDIVLIHDAVRPFVTEEILRQNILGAMQYGAVNTCVSSVDTLVHSSDGETIDSIPPRTALLRGQTPQTFSYALILEAHKKAQEKKIANASDDCQLVLALGQRVFFVQGDEKNIKITTELDLQIAETIHSRTIFEI